MLVSYVHRAHGMISWVIVNCVCSDNHQTSGTESMAACHSVCQKLFRKVIFEA